MAPSSRIEKEETVERLRRFSPGEYPSSSAILLPRLLIFDAAAAGQGSGSSSSTSVRLSLRLAEAELMGFLGTILAVLGFGAGIPLGLLLGYFFFFYSDSSDVRDPITRKIHDLDSKSLKQLLPEIPLWIKRPDFERVDWMNRFIAELWPWFDKAACCMIGSASKPTFDHYIGKFGIESIEFGSLTLGTLPPLLHGVNFYETNGRELIIETAVRWAGNPNVVLAVDLMGFRVTAQLIDSQIFLSLRFMLKPLVPAFPCFAGVAISLMEKPRVDFGLKLAGADIMAIPILYKFAQKKIKEQIGDLYLWPQTLQIPILEGFSATKKPVGILHVKVVRAIGLLKMDFLGKSDPYVKLYLSGDRIPSKKTTVKMCELNPVWNERFKLVVKDPLTQSLELHVYDWEKVKTHDKLGMQVVPLSQLRPNQRRTFALDLVKNLNPNDSQNRRSRGKIELELRFVPFKDDEEEESPSVNSPPAPVNSPAPPVNADGVLSVAVIRASDVEGKHHNNPYAIVHFKGEQRKTKVVKRSREPRWEEEFQFMLEGGPVDQKIHIEVVSKRMGFSFHSKDSLGHVDVNLLDVVNSGRINETYNLINSKRGVIHVDIKWRTA